MRVLVTAASKHGSTTQIANDIVTTLVDHGLDAEFRQPDEVDSLDEYDAVIVGSAVYITQWLEEARHFTTRFQTQLRNVPLWAFSVGMAEVPKYGSHDTSRVGAVSLNINPKEHVHFKGVLDPEKLSLRERTIAKLGGALEGDYREAEVVKAWADKIAAQLRS